MIVHVCNDVGGWGRGFVLALSARWPEPEADYISWYHEGDAGGFRLGAVRFVAVDDDLWVANVIGQRGLVSTEDGPPIRYEAIEAGLAAVADHATERHASVHMPRIGCGLAGGTWEAIEPIIQSTLIVAGINTTVYDL